MTRSAEASDENVQLNSANHNVSPSVITFRTILPQIIACAAKNLLLYQIGLAIAFPANVIPVLRKAPIDGHSMLSLTAEQSSWYGSITFLAQPVGSMFSGWLTEPIGRKWSMILVNIPNIAGWTFLYFASNISDIYIGGALLGLGVGLMEAPVITYLGEISQPAIRGVLLAFSNTSAMFGLLTIYLLGAMIDWRNVALVCFFVPVMTSVILYLVPETPYWLLSRNKKEQALKSLQWLRGWVEPDVVQKEFNEIQRYNKTSNFCSSCAAKKNNVCQHLPKSIFGQLMELSKQNARRSILLATLCFLLANSNGLTAIRPYFKQVFKMFGVPINPSWVSVFIGTMDVTSTILSIVLVKVTGKRKIFLFSIAGGVVCCFGLALNAYSVLPAGTNSFDFIDRSDNNKNVMALILFICLGIVNGIGVGVPWMLLSEIFPFRVRGVASGLVPAISYLYGFLIIKSQIDLETYFAASGSFAFYGCIGLIGFFAVYAFLPETENFTLEEIDMYFSDKSRNLTNRKIKKIIEV